MKTEIQWAELHAPLFLNGTNLGQKLDPTKRSSLAMHYDEEKKHLYVSYKGTAAKVMTARIPETSVLSMVEGMPMPQTAKVQVAQAVNQSQAPEWPVHAQAETPYGHVFKGPGHGQTGQEPPVERKKPGPKPKEKA